MIATQATVAFGSVLSPDATVRCVGQATSTSDDDGDTMLGREGRYECHISTPRRLPVDNRRARGERRAVALTKATPKSVEATIEPWQCQLDVQLQRLLMTMRAKSRPALRLGFRLLREELYVEKVAQTVVQCANRCLSKATFSTWRFSILVYDSKMPVVIIGVETPNGNWSNHKLSSTAANDEANEPFVEPSSDCLPISDLEHLWIAASTLRKPTALTQPFCTRRFPKQLMSTMPELQKRLSAIRKIGWRTHRKDSIGIQNNEHEARFENAILSLQYQEPEAAHLLNTLAFFNLQDISAEVFIQAAGGGAPNALITGGRLGAWEPGYTTPDPLQVKRVSAHLQTLAKYSFIVSSVSGEVYQMASQVDILLRRRQDLAHVRYYSETAALVLCCAFAGQPKELPVRLRLSRHLQTTYRSLLTAYTSGNVERDVMKVCLRKAADFGLSIGEPEMARCIFWFLLGSPHGWSKDDLTTDEIELESMYNFALSLFRLGRNESAWYAQRYLLRSQRALHGRHSMEVLRTKLLMGMTYRSGGNTGLASDLVREVFEAYKARLDFQDDRTSFAYQQVALNLEYTGNKRRAAYNRAQLLTELTRAYGKRDERTLLAMHEYADSLFSLRQLDEATKMAKEAHQLRCEVLGEYHPDTLETANDLICYMKAVDPKLADAEEYFPKVLQWMREKMGDMCWRTLNCMNDYATALGHNDKDAKALTVQEEAVEKCSRLLGRTHPGTLTFRVNLVNIHEQLGKEDLMLRELRTLVPDLEQICGVQNEITLTTAGQLINVLLHKTTDYDEASEEALVLARRYYHLIQKMQEPPRRIQIYTAYQYAAMLTTNGELKQAEEILRKVMNMSDILKIDFTTGLLRVLEQLVTVLIDRNRLNEAEMMCQRTLNWTRKALGENTPETLPTIGLLADIWKKTGYYIGKILELKRQTVKLYEERREPSYQAVFQARCSLTATLLEQQQYKEAEEKQRQNVADTEKALGLSHSRTINQWYRLADTVLKSDKKREATELKRRVYLEFLHQFGEDHVQTWDAMFRLSESACDGNERDAYLEMGWSSLQALQRHCGANSEEVLTFKNNFGLKLKQIGKREEATNLMREVLHAREASLPLDHEDVLLSMHNLGITLAGQAGDQDNAEAESLFMRVVEERANHLPQGMEAFQDDAVDLNSYFEHNGKWSDYAAFWEQLLDKHVGRLGEASVSSCSIIRKAVLGLRNAKIHDKADIMERRLVAIETLMYGAADSRTIDSMFALACHLDKRDRPAEAEQVFRKILDVLTKARNPPLELLGFRGNIALTLKKQGKTEEYEAMCRSRMWETAKISGWRHPTTLTPLRQLFNFYMGRNKNDAIKFLEEVQSEIHKTVEHDYRGKPSLRGWINSLEDETEEAAAARASDPLNFGVYLKYGRVNRTFIHPRTLRKYKIPFERSLYNKDSLVIKRLLCPRDLDRLFRHTSRLRKKWKKENETDAYNRKRSHPNVEGPSGIRVLLRSRQVKQKQKSNNARRRDVNKTCNEEDKELVCRGGKKLSKPDKLEKKKVRQTRKRELRASTRDRVMEAKEHTKENEDVSTEPPASSWKLAKKRARLEKDRQSQEQRASHPSRLGKRSKHHRRIDRLEMAMSNARVLEFGYRY